MTYADDLRARWDLVTNEYVADLLANAEAEISDLQANVISLAAQRDALQEQLTIALSDDAADEQQIADLVSQVAAMTGQVANLETVNDELRQALADCQAGHQATPMITGQNMPLSASAAYLGTTETADQIRARVINTYTRFPMAKVFYDGNSLPAQWDANREGKQPEKRVIVCYQNSANIASYAASVPPGWWVIFVPWQEADLKIQGGSLSVATFHAFFTRDYPVIHNAQKPGGIGGGGNRLELWPCFASGSGYKTNAADRAASLDEYVSYVPPAGKYDGIGHDNYVNPFGVPGPAGGVGEASAYKPDGPTRLAFTFDINKRVNCRRTGIMEFGAPWRTWDTGRVERNRVLTEYVDYLAAGYDLADGTHVTPEFCIFFNQVGSNWDQRIVAPPLGAAEPFVTTWRDRNSASG